MSDDALLDRVNAFLEESGISAADLAREAGISPSTLSRLRSGAYRGNAMAAEMGLRQVLDRYDANRLVRMASTRRCWLVRSGDDIRLVKQRHTMERLRRDHPEALIIQVWMGEHVRQTYCVPQETTE